MANPQNLTPEQVAYFKSLLAPTQYGQNGAQYTRDGLMPVYNQSWAASPETGQGPSGDGSLMSIVGPGRNPEENAEFSPDGEFQKYYTVKDRFMGMDPALAFALATGGMMMLPGGPLNGLFGSGAAAGDGATLAGSDGASTLAGGAGSDTAGASVFNAAKDSQLANIGADVVSPLTGYQAAGATPAAVDLGSAAAKSGNWLTDLLPGGVGDALGKLAPNLIGATLGAASSKDQTQTNTKAPWEAVQPWMKDNIAKGQDLQKQYEANPFNATQKNALQQLLDVSNTGSQALPGLLDFSNRMQQSNYQRSGGRNLAYSAPRTTAPNGVMPTGLMPATPLDWLSLPTARKA